MSITDKLLEEITREGSNRKSIAVVYREGIWMHTNDCERVDWAVVNAAILSRYSVSGLNYIKAQAWKR